MPFVRIPSSALGRCGLILSAAFLTLDAAAHAEDKPAFAQSTPATAESSPSTSSASKQDSAPSTSAVGAATEPAAKKEGVPKKRSRSARDTTSGEKSDADIASRKPPPPSESLDAQRAKFTRVKTEGTGAGHANDESDKVVTPPAPPASSASPTIASQAPEKETDEKLRERVQATLLSERKLPYTARMVGVSVKKGTITLSGEVNTDYERTRVSQVVDRMRGRHDVINQISVRNRAPESLQATAK